MWVSELLPYTAKMVDDMCFIRSMHTEAINHEPAITYMQTGNQVTGRPCLGPGFRTVWARSMTTCHLRRARRPSSNTEQTQAISARLWSSGYLSESTRASPSARAETPSSTSTTRWSSASMRRRTLDGSSAERDERSNPRRSRNAHSHRAVRAGVPHASKRPGADECLERAGFYLCPLWRGGEKARTFANTVLLARRMVERGVRFIQVYHNNWDTHANVAGRLPSQCKDVDQACWA